MFKNCIYNIIGDVPFSSKAFPMIISIGNGFCETKVCYAPADIPQGVDFVIDASGSTPPKDSREKE